MYGRGGHFGHVIQTPRINFRSPIPLRFHMKFGFGRPSGFGEEDLENGGRRTDDDGPMDDGPWLYYKLTNESKGSGELKTKQNLIVKIFQIYSFLITRSVIARVSEPIADCSCLDIGPLVHPYRPARVAASRWRKVRWNHKPSTR